MTRILDAYFMLLKILAAGLLGLMLIPVTLQIFSRYTGMIPRYIWTEEAARFCFIWIIILGASIAVREGTHFTVDVLPQPKTATGDAIGQFAVIVFMSTLALVFALYGYDYALFGYRQTSELTGINMFFIHVVYLLAGISWLVFLAERVVHVLGLLRKRSV